MRHLVENMFFWYQNYTTILYYTTNEYYAESAIISERTQDMKNRTKYQYYINPGGGYDLEKMSDGRMAAVLTNDVSISVVVLSVTQ